MTIGTAGHIDHGKSSLIYALTAIDPDRLPEEKRRGMTIDLGFAWLELASGETVGIVDVPGHKHFVRNVIPGLGGIDAALLVVAADDGWMPQTEEHVQIIDLLGIKNGIVALTKVDLIDDSDWLELVEKDIGHRIDSSSLRGAPIIRVSTKDGRGLDELKKAIGRLVAEVTARRDIGKPRLPVDRVFTMKGSGVVVTGTLSCGSFSSGDPVTISPKNRPAHLRSIESYKQRIDVAQPGSRVALNLTGAKKEDIERGDIIFIRGKETRATRLIDVQLRLLPRLDSPLKSNTELVVFMETRELLGKVILLGAKTIPAAGSALAQLRLGQDVATYIGQHFILRRQSPVQTIGGGVVLDPLASRHRLKDSAKVLAFLERRISLELAELILSELEKNGYVTGRELLSASGYSSAEIASGVSRLKGQNRLVVAGSYVIDTNYWQQQAEAVLEVLTKEHSLHPLNRGLSLAELNSRLALPREVFTELVTALAGSGRIVRREDVIALSAHRPRLSPEQEKLVTRILTLFSKSGTSPPTKKELSAQIPGSEALVGFMCRQNMLLELPGGILLESKHYEAIKKEIIGFLERNGSISIQQVNSLFGFSRKYSIPLLTQLDKEGITRREGDVRILAERRQ